MTDITKPASLPSSSPHQTISLADCSGVQLWLNAQISPATVENYTRHVSRLIEMTGKNPADCTLDDLQQFIKKLNTLSSDAIGTNKLFKKQPSPSTVVAIIQAVKSLFSFMHRAGVIHYNPAIMIRTNTQTKRKRVDLPASNDFVSKCASLAHNTAYRKKDRLAAFAVLFLATSGLRASEAGNAKMEDVFWQGGRPWLNILGKGAKLREVVLLPSLLKIRSSITEDTEWLIPETFRASGARLVVWRMVKRAATLTGTNPKDVHPHLLRHFHASTLLDSGDVTLAETRDNLGHGNIAVTSLYLHTNEDKRHDAISAALDKLTQKTN